MRPYQALPRLLASPLISTWFFSLASADDIDAVPRKPEGVAGSVVTYFEKAFPFKE